MEQSIEPDGPVTCNICNEQCINRTWLRDHIVKSHVAAPSYHCPYDPCGSVYRNASSLRSHIHRQHRPLFASRSNNNSNLNDSNSSSSSDEDEDLEEDPDVPSDPDDNPESDNNSDVIMHDEGEELTKKSVAEYLLYLRAYTRATNDDVLCILDQLQKVVKAFVRYYLEKTANIVQEAIHVNLHQYINVADTIASIDCSFDLNTIYKQNVYFQDNFGVIQPFRRLLGNNFEPYGTPANEGNQPFTQKKDEFIHIPVSTVLQHWFQNGDFRNLIEIRRPREDVVMASYADGILFKSHPFRIEKPLSLAIRLFYDEAEMCDSLGSKAGSMNKLGFFYWTLEDMSPTCKSKLKFINLTGIISYPHVKNYGIDRILEEIIKDFKTLETEGIELANGEKIHCFLSAFSGDNLAAHQVCGFRESFVATHPCRICMATLQEVREDVKQNDTLLRTPEQHDLQVQKIEDANDGEKEALRQQYGINRRCKLNELSGFHAATSAPPDIVHDDLEGVCIVTVKCFLREICLQQNYISLEDLNERIRLFDRGYSQKSSKPSVIKEKQLNEKEGIKQSASQMWQLVTILPLLLNDVVPHVLPAYQNFLKMLEFLCISFADKINERMLVCLGDSILQYLESFKEVYNKNFTPKQHFLVHRVQLIQRYGPVSHFTTIREEANHQPSKREAQCKRTYKNLPLTLAKKRQLFQAAVMRETLQKTLETGPTRTMNVDVPPFQTLFPGKTHILTTSWIERHGIKYVASKCFLAIGYSTNYLPQFAALHKICLNNEFPVLLCKKVETVELDVTVMAYEIKVVDDYFLLSFNDLFSHHVFHSHHLKDKDVIIVKRALGSLH